MLIRGWITYYDPYADPHQAFMFLHDRTGDIFVSLPKQPVLAVRQGMPVEVSGVSDAGEFAPIVAQGNAKLIDGPAISMIAQPVELPLLLLGGYDARFVQVLGVVQGVFGSDRNVVLKLSTANGVVRATTLREPNVYYTRLIDAEIRVSASIAPQFNHRRQVIGAHLYFASTKNVQIERKAQPDLFARSPRPISDITKTASGLGVLNSVLIRGRVTLQWPGRLLCVQDPSGGLCVESTQPDILEVGELVDVVGFPRMDDPTAGLVEASFRRSGGSLPIAAVETSPKELLRGGYAGDLVTVDGRLIGINQDLGEQREGQTLTIESDGKIFPVLLPDGPRSQDWHARTKGSVLRLTGVCLPEVDPHRREVTERGADFDSFRLLLRTPSDVEVVEVPSWWNGPHVLNVISVSALICTVGCAWVVVLRRQVAQQTSVIRESEERFRHQAEHDGLTGLANRRLLQHRLETALRDAHLHSTSMAVLMVDLDKFKQTNDEFGHSTGDAMLCAVATRIGGCVRHGDTVARMGGDEFVVLLSPLANATEAYAIADRIVEAVGAPFTVDGHSVPMSASAGICVYPEGGADLEALLRNCDAALYEAKAQGRNRWQVFAQVRSQRLRDVVVQ